MDGHDFSAFRQQLDRIEEKLDSFTSKQKNSELSQLRIFIDSSSKERKPFTITLGGTINGTISVSETRAAIFVVLLLDLIKRSESGEYISDIIREITKVYEELRGQLASDNSEQGAVRVAIYRFQKWLNKGALSGDASGKIKLNDSFRLEIYSSDGSAIRPEDLEIEVSASSSKLTRIMHRVLSTSPLSQLKRKENLLCPKRK